MLLIFFLSFLFTQDSRLNHHYRCALDDMSQLNRVRPELDTLSISPSGYFYIHYDLESEHSPSLVDDNNNGVPDYVDAVGIAADSSKYVIENQMGFQVAAPDSNGIYDIYLQDLGPFFYGANFSDFFVEGSYIIIDNEFEEGEYFTSGIPAMQVAVAHEYFHAVQRNYAQLVLGHDKYFWELSSTWIEEVIYPDSNDYLYWMDYYLEHPEQNISDYMPNNPDTEAGYSLAMFGNYLTKMYDVVEDQKDSVIMRKIWELFTGYSTDNARISINQVLNNDYNSSFVIAWTDFCSKNLYNGLFDNMNNSIYYHEDQSFANPIQTNPVLLNRDVEISDLVLNNKSIAPILSFFISDFITLDLNHSLSDIEYYGLSNIFLSSSINNQITELDNQSSINLSESDIIHLVYSSFTDRILNLDVIVNDDFCCDLGGDLNEDGVINIIDIIIIVNTILDNEGYHAMHDINNDGVINISDVILLSDMILYGR